MKKGDKAMGIWGLIVILVVTGWVFSGLIATASATDYNNIAIESCTVFKCQNCESYKVVTDPWNYPDTTALCYVHKGQYYAWTGETYGGWRKIWVAPYSNDYKGTTGWIYEGTYWARETKTVLRAKTTLAVYKSLGSGLYGYIYNGQKFYYLGSSGDWFKIQMCGDTAGGGAMHGWVHGGSAVQTPTVETRSATSVTETAATLNGIITDDGGASIDERRFDWGTTSSCSDGWTNSVTVSGNSFSYRLTGLEPGKTYYFRAWAHNSGGWGHGNVLHVTPPPHKTNLQHSQVVM